VRKRQQRESEIENARGRGVRAVWTEIDNQRTEIKDPPEPTEKIEKGEE